MCVCTVYICECVCVYFVVESWWRWCDTLWHSRTSRNPAVFTVWLPGNTGPYWKKAADRKSRASMQHGNHVAPTPTHPHVFEKLKVLAMKCVRALLMALPLRDVQYVQRVMAKPACVNGFVHSNSKPRAAYVCVRVTATHRDAESERCVCHYQTAAMTWLELNSKLSMFPSLKVERDFDISLAILFFSQLESRERGGGGVRIQFKSL